MEYLSEWVLLVVVFGFAVIAPGPDFVMAVRNSIVFSRKAGLYTAAGFALGVCVHVVYSIIGLSVVIAQSAFLFSVIKYIGAGYLLYVGVKSLRSKGQSLLSDDVNMPKPQAAKDMTPFQALRCGFITNVFNPKAIMFFLALFTQILSPDLPLSVQMVFGMTCAVMVWAWFSFVALVLTHQRVRSVFLGVSKWIDRVCGGLMIGLGVKLALTK